MMTSVKQLIDMNNITSTSGGDQYSMLIQGIAGTQIVPNLTIAPVQKTTVQMQKPPKDPSTVKKN